MTQPNATQRDVSSEPHGEESQVSSNAKNGRRRWRFELIILALALVVGLIVLPAAIYEFGIVELGPYDGGTKTIWSFYGAYFRNLGDGMFRTWFLVVSPYVYLMLLRLVFLSWKRRPAATETPPVADNIKSSASPPTPPTDSRRREPFVGS